MTTDEELCSWSDLPMEMCDHCNPGPRPHPDPKKPTPPSHGVALVRPHLVSPPLTIAARNLLGLDQAPIHIYEAHDLYDYLDQLAWPMASSEPYEISKPNRDGTVTRIHVNHPSKHLPLITQLWRAGNQTPHDDEGARPGYASKPTARIDALDAHNRIDTEAARWVRKLGDDDDLDTLHTLRHLKGMAAAIELKDDHKPTSSCCFWHHLERDARSWWVQCRVLTGWDSSAWRPDNTCPPCGTRGSLRIKFLTKTAMCVECREVWDDTTIGVLADHIRDESEAERFTIVDEPCFCRWPQEPQLWRMVVCPDCGSRYCVKTEDMIVKKLPRRRVG